MRLERAPLERTARLANPFLSTLRYAFREGPWLVLAMPLLSGGTLQVAPQLPPPSNAARLSRRAARPSVGLALFGKSCNAESPPS